MHERDYAQLKQATQQIRKRYKHITDLDHTEIKVHEKIIERYEELLTELHPLISNMIYVEQNLTGNFARTKWHLWTYLPKPNNKDLKKNKFNFDARTGKISWVIIDKFYIGFKEALREIKTIAEKEAPSETETYLDHFLEDAYQKNQELFNFLGFRKMPNWEQFTHNVFRDVRKIEEEKQKFYQKCVEYDEQSQKLT